MDNSPLEAYYKKPLKHATWACFLQHFFWILLFFWLDIPILTELNILSCVIYIFCSLLLKKRMYGIFTTVVIVEVMANISFTTYIMGWDAGFHYFLFILIYGAFFVPKMKNGEKIFVIVLNIFIYLFLHNYTSHLQIKINDFYLKGISYLNIISVFLIIALLSAFFRKTVDKSIDELMMLASVDPLTGLINRRTMYEMLDKVNKKAVSTGKSFSIFIADIDNFKIFNDQYGHDCGDAVLMQCAKTIQAIVRGNGEVARWGGEEFLVLHDSANHKTATTFAEELRSTIENTIFNYQEHTFTVSLTIGVATYRQGERISELVTRADHALIAGKKEGKNMVKAAHM